jgi:hypothetical protein
MENPGQRINLEIDASNKGGANRKGRTTAHPKIGWIDEAFRRTLVIL